MSIKVMSRVWDNSIHKGSTLLLLLAIADNADSDGYAFPGTEYLAKKIRMSERQVKRIRQTLYDSGELEYLSGGRFKGDKLSVRVRVTNCRKGDKLSVKGDKLSPKGDKLSPKGDTLVTLTVINHHEPSTESSDVRTPTADFPTPVALLTDPIVGFNLTQARKFKHLTPDYIARSVLAWRDTDYGVGGLYRRLEQEWNAPEFTDEHYRSKYYARHFGEFDFVTAAAEQRKQDYLI